jgi:hypothetical protein
LVVVLSEMRPAGNDYSTSLAILGDAGETARESMKSFQQLLVVTALAWASSELSAKAGAPVYPLTRSANGRYLVDQSNAPVLIMGDSPQALIVNLSEAEADMFFGDRNAFGFNTLWINLLCSTYTGGRADASTIDGLVPFTAKIAGTSSYDLAATNEAYFARVDRILNLASQHGLQVLLDPVETGTGGQFLVSLGHWPHCRWTTGGGG